MTYHWQAETEHGHDLSDSSIQEMGLDEEFDDQESAEAWLRDYFSILPDYGVTSVSLYDGEDLVFGPMSLDEDKSTN